MIAALFKHRLFKTNRNWKGSRALVPVDICYSVLDVFAWTAFLGSAIGVVLLYVEHLLNTPSAPLALAVYLTPIPAACAAIFRRLPFTARFALVALTLMTYLVGSTLEVGVTPNTSLYAIVLVAALGLFFGPRAGLAGLGLVAAILVASAWGWTRGYLPLTSSPVQSPGGGIDFRSLWGWARVLPVMGFFIAALLAVMGSVLQRLRNALNESGASLALLAEEKAKVQQRTAELLLQAQLLRTSEHKFRTLFETASDAIFLMDDRIFLSCNRMTETIFGCRQEEIIGQSPVRFSPTRQPDGRESAVSARERIQAALAGSPQTFAWQHLRLDGTPFDTEVSLNRVEVEGRVILQAIVRDVTVRNRAEAALKESEVLRKRVFESLRVPIVVMDAETSKYVDCNQAAVEIYRFTSREEILGKTPLDVSAPVQYDGAPSTEKARHYTGKALAEGSVVFEWRHRRPDGEIWDAEVHLMSFQSGQHNLLQFTLQDITQRKLTAAALRESEERHRRIAKCVPDLIWSMDLSGRYTYLSAALERTHGWKVEEGLGRTFHFLMTPEQAALDAVMIEEELARMASPLSDRNEMRTYESEEVRKDGSVFWAEVSATFLWSDEGQPVGIVGITRDITERRRAQEEHQSLQARLVQAQKMEAIGQLAGGVAHDFNNILTAIMMQLSVLQDDAKLSEEMRNGLKDLEDEAGRAANLTRQLLMFSRRQVLQPRILDLNSLLGNLLKMLRRVIGEHINLEFGGAHGDLWLEADPGMLEQVVMNLVVNARDSMPAGGRIRLTTRSVDLDASASQRNPEASAGQFVCLSVSDTGSGMDDATAKRIFEPFFTTKEAGKGTGLGLATVYGIVKQHRGWIEVETAIGRGSTFSVYLPGRPDASGSIRQTPDDASMPGGSENLLVVEDEGSVRRGLCEIMEKLGYRIRAADNGPDAFRKWAELGGRIDLLITDIVMPGGISGIDLADRLRKRKPALKVILISGYSPEIVGHGVPQEPGIRYLQKPFSAEALARMTRELLDAG